MPLLIPQMATGVCFRETKAQKAPSVLHLKVKDWLVIGGEVTLCTSLATTEELRSRRTAGFPPAALSVLPSVGPDGI